jgi:MFS family permease
MSEHPGGTLPTPPATTGSSQPSSPKGPAAGWSPWRVVVGFGVVSLAADMVYEGARSIYGPLLASLGASALVVGLVTGAGEATALVLRLAFGPLADRTGRYWALTLAGYALTAVCVPLLAVAPFAGGAGLVLAALLILAERAGKAVRSPSKSALLAHAAGAVGRGRGFAVHKALDQVGAFAGPLLVAAVIAATTAIWPAMALLAVPGGIAIGLLLWIRARVPDPAVFDAQPSPPAAARADPRSSAAAAIGAGLPRRFFWFAASAGATTAGLVTFGVISFHLTQTGLVPVAAVPVIYAAAMAAAAVAALASGWLYDRWSARVLFAVPLLVAAVPALALSSRVTTAVGGVLVWGAAVGVQDSTVKALVADLVPAPRRATAYGIFAAIQGAAAIAGGGLAGALYTESLPALVIVVAATQLLALVLLSATLVGGAGRRPG